VTKPKTNYIFHETVDYIEEKFLHVCVSGHGPTAKFKDIPIGWYLRLVGSNESFFISHEEPALHAGDKVKITIEKVIP
jgi:hypothetical protein